jgi:hypothetical protein
MMLARLGPTSAIRRKNTRKASAVHTSPSTTTDASASPDGSWVGKPPIANGSSMIVAMPSAPATGPSGSTAVRWRLAISGPQA